MKRQEDGLTLIEVMMAIAVFGLLLTVLGTALVGAMRSNTLAGQRTQAVQVLNFLGRRVVGGDDLVLPAAGRTLSWNYGQLKTAFRDLSDQGGFSNPDNYRASVTSAGAITLATSSAVQYDVQVCFRRGGNENCLDTATIGPAPVAGGTAPLLPGIN